MHSRALSRWRGPAQAAGTGRALTLMGHKVLFSHIYTTKAGASTARLSAL